MVVKLCLSTGARWSEATGLRSEHAIRDRVTFIDTKNGKNRTVPISDELFKQITEQKRRVLFPDVDYVNVVKQLKAVAPDLPKGQAVHVLRHTFASYFMMNGGNILTLQKILGHDQSAIRALAFKWIRIIYRCWKTRTQYDEAKYLLALEARHSPLLKS